MSGGSEIGFKKALAFVSDVQVTHTRSPDGREMSILFDNLTLQANRNDQNPVHTHTLSLVLGLDGGAAMLKVRLQLRGAAHLSPGFHATACLLLNGRAEPPVSRQGKESNLAIEAEREVRAAAGLPVTLWLALTRDLDADVQGAGLLAVDSLDLAVEPLLVEGGKAADESTR